MKSHKNHSRVNLPREHGAWAMFGVPLGVGIAIAQSLTLTTILFALTAFGFFLLRYPLMLVLRVREPHTRRDAIGWSVIYGAFTGLGGMLLFLFAPLWEWLWLGILGALTLAIYLWLATRRAEMTLAGEWLGVAGLALSAPGAYLATTGTLDWTALQVYVLNMLYFGGTIFYIKFKVREQPRVVAPYADWRTRLRAGRLTLAYHALVFVFIIALTILGSVPALVPLAFAPTMCKMISGVLNRPTRINLKQLGLIELGLSIMFAFLILLAYE